MKKHLVLVLKGMAMGAANVIPGVSGGTIALITGIFERLIDAIKSFNLDAVKLILKGKFKEFAKHTDLQFLITLFTGVGVAIITIAKLFRYLFDHHPTYIWAFFFGLVLASVYFVGKTVSKWNTSVIISFIIGTCVALALTLLKPATESDATIYLILCGVVAACSMILPGLSGSFVLILMGNYELVMVNAVSKLQINILLPVVFGAGFGIIGFSHFLSWIFKKYRNQTISILTGFILGSLGNLWPWKDDIIETFGKKEVVVGHDWHIPTMDNSFLLAALLIVLGFVSIWLTEKYAESSEA